jgi:hypothetical protein
VDQSRHSGERRPKRLGALRRAIFTSARGCSPRRRLNGHEYRSIGRGILTIVKFLPNVTYAAETVASEIQQMLEEVRKISPSPDCAAVPLDAATSS